MFGVATAAPDPSPTLSDGVPADPEPAAPPEALKLVSRVSSWDLDGLCGMFGVATAAPDCPPTLLDAEPTDDPDPAAPLPAPPPLPPPCPNTAEVVKARDAAAKRATDFEAMALSIEKRNLAKLNQFLRRMVAAISVSFTIAKPTLLLRLSVMKP